MDIKIPQKESDTIWVMKGIAILSVFYAHMSSSGGHEDLRCILGTIGVAAYFVLSGYLFHKPLDGAGTFWLKKVKTVILPWLICAVLTFGLSVVLGNKFAIGNLLQWVLGVGTWYYFIPMLLLCFVIYSICTADAVLYIAVILNIVSLVMTQLGYLQMPGILTNYLNVLNWMGFFAIGIF